jgi:serine/threonine protein kinase/WD40 repeat protein/tetratricopeptide (TPR) repeat protein
MNQASSEPDLFNELAHEYAERYRRGERPDLSEYTDKYPDLAGEIRELFPALVVMEEFGAPADADSPAAKASPAAPTQLGEYRILREVGRGGMGVVYEAVQESLGRHVALKVFPYNALANPTHLERFRREAKAAARLHHTNIVPVFAVGEHAGFHYYAMQFILGQGLDEVLREVRRLRGEQAVHGAETAAHFSLALSVAEGLLTGHFPEAASRARLLPLIPAGKVPDTQPALTSPHVDASNAAAVKSECTPTLHSEIASQRATAYYRSVAQIGVQVAEALDYAHHQGVLHRDIKPSNLLLDTAGQVWVTDFGLAKADDSDDLTHTGDLVGTLRYMAPERFGGQADARSDIYGLGITLYELLTLRPAFNDSQRARLIDEVTKVDPPRPRKLDQQIPHDLETIVLKAIAKNPAGRYAHAAGLAEDLRRFLADRPVRARRSPLWERGWRWCRRNPAVASLAGTVATLLLLVAVISSVSAVWLRQALSRSENAEEAERTAKHDALDKLWESSLAQARFGRVSGRLGQRVQSLRALQEAARIRLTPELRNEAIACLTLPDVEVAVESELPEDWRTGWYKDLAFSATLDRYARLDQRGAVTIRRTSDHAELAQVPANKANSALRISADGGFLAVTQEPPAPIIVWDIRGKDPSPVIDVPVAVTAVAFAPDNQRVAVGCTDGSIGVYDLRGGERHCYFRSGAPLQYQQLAFHPTRPWLAVGSGTSVFIRQLPTGEVLTELRHLTRPGSLCWHPDGKVLAVACDDRKIYLWDIENPHSSAILEGHRNLGIHFTFNHRGDLLVSNDWNSILRLWDLRTGRQIFSTPALTPRLAFSPDDRLLAAQIEGNKMRLLRLTTGQGFRSFSVERGSVSQSIERAAVSPDGRLLVVSTDAGLAFVDLATGENVAYVARPTLSPVQFDPSGALLTKGVDGLLRWPVRRDRTDPGKRYIGPPKPLCRLVTELPGVSNDAHVVVLSRYSAGALLLHLEPPTSPIVLFPQDNVRFCAVSPDGRWVATGSHGSRSCSCKVWDGATGALVKELPMVASCGAGFSPDSRWLITTAGGCRLWSVGSWDAGAAPGGMSFAFSLDNSLLAVDAGFGVVRLIPPDNGEEYARLESPVQTRLLPLCFTPDGTQLIMKGLETNQIYVWDLRAIREQLAAIGLDWDLPSYPPDPQGNLPAAGTAGLPNIPLRVSVDPGPLPVAGFRSPEQGLALYSVAIALCPFNAEAYVQRAMAYDRLGQLERALADYSMALFLLPRTDRCRCRALARRAGKYFLLGDLARARQDLRSLAELRPDGVAEMDGIVAQLCNNVAWLSVARSMKDRDPSGALPVAQMAVALMPDEPIYLNTLGLVCYRVRQYDLAISALERCLRADPVPVYDLLFLAMCHARRGEPTKAREYYDRALVWIQQYASYLSGEWHEEVKTFQAEAADVLGLKDQRTSRQQNAR